MNFYNFIFKKKYFDLFSFKKSDLYKLLKKNMTLFAKEFLIKKKLNPLFLKITFNPILIKEKEFIF